MKVPPFLERKLAFLSFSKLSIFATSILIILFFLQNCVSPAPEGNEIIEGAAAPDLVPSSNKFLTSTAYQVPHDIADSSQTALAEFAWKEFIALNWPSSYNTSTHTRGKPDSTQNLSNFLKPNPNHALVWQTYKHRVEIYPKNTSDYNDQFDTAPQYFFDIEGQDSIMKYKDPGAPPLHKLTKYFNNLDETSEIGLCTIFYDGDPDAPGASSNPNPSITNGGPGAPRRVIYQAKGSRVMFDYVVKNKLYDATTRMNRKTQSKASIKNGHAGLPTCPDDGLICFPHGKIGGTEGSIEIKASWRQLTLDEYNTGRFLTAPIVRYIKAPKAGSSSDSLIYYDIVPAEPTDTTLPYGLLGLHIIHKTVHFPTYVFATFEQVDNLNPSKKLNQLYYYNAPRGGIVSPGRQNVVNRPHAIMAATDSVTAEVHREIYAMDTSSVWRYYKLVGVQGQATNNQDTTDFFLANIVTETNEVLRSFSGTLNNNNGTIDPTSANIHVGKQLIIGGGCKGCHGNAQVSDFSFITQNAPFEGTPDVINQTLNIPAPPPGD